MNVSESFINGSIPLTTFLYGNDTLDMGPTPNPQWNLDLNYFPPNQVMFVDDIDIVKQDWSKDPAFLPTTLVYSLAFIIGVTGNALVVYVLIVDKKAHNVTNTFLVSLAIADLLFLLLVVPYEMAYKMAGYWSGAQIFCKMSALIEMLTGAATIWNLTAVGVERYIVIVHPLKTRTICSLGNAKRIIVVVWCIAILMSLHCLYVFSTNDHLYYDRHTYYIVSICTIVVQEKQAVAWYHLLVMFLLPTIIMGFCYTRVITVLWDSTRELAKLTHTSRSSSSDDATLRISLTKRSQLVIKNKDQSSEIMESRKQVIRMLLAIIVVFLVCWGPQLILNLIKNYECKCLHNDASFIAMMAFRLLPYVQSTLNPIIYMFMSKNFRQSMRRTFQKCCPCIAANSNNYSTDILRLESYSKTVTTVQGNNTSPIFKNIFK